MGCASAAISTLLFSQTFVIFFADEKVHNPVLMSCRRLCKMSCQMFLHQPDKEQVTHFPPVGSYACASTQLNHILASALERYKENQETHRCVGEICKTMPGKQGCYSPKKTRLLSPNEMYAKALDLCEQQHRFKSRSTRRYFVAQLA